MAYTYSASNVTLLMQASLNDLDIFVYDILAGRPALNEIHHDCRPGFSAPVNFDTYTNFFHCSNCAWIAAYNDIKDEFIVRGALPPLRVVMKGLSSGSISYDPAPLTPKVKKLACGCGADSIKAPFHKDYCPKYVKP
jgi:hypothetical protein